MNNNQKIEIYGNHLDNFKNPLIKEIVEEVIIHTPIIFFGASTSSSGKYHPLATNGVMGLAKHSLATMLTANDLLRNDTIMKIFGLENLSDIDKEIILAACLLHDNAKYGANEGDLYTDEKLYTNKEHPRLVSGIAENAGLFDADEENQVIYLLRILELIETHMGQWTDTNEKYGKPPKLNQPDLDKPETKQQAFVHMCDYIVSRKTLDVVSELSMPEGVEPKTLDWFVKQNS